MQFIVAADDTPRGAPATPDRIRAFFRRDELWYGDEAWLAAPAGTELAIACVGPAVTRPHDPGEFTVTLLAPGSRHEGRRSLRRDEAEALFLQFARGDRSGLSRIEWDPPRHPSSSRPAI